MQSAHFAIVVDVLLKCCGSDTYTGEQMVTMTTSGSARSSETLSMSRTPIRRARGIIDISNFVLGDVPFALEEKLRKSKGVISVQLNAFSKKLAIEFDPSVTSLDEILKIIRRRA
ncbi:MAG TPA: hypothetical protein VFE96_04690 [Candidatus Bathyarchaeia archaeon]|jgi:hypothetical protein|nr:hypothetical protein [Candidatus Bathyarchaeia archaeon]